MSTYNLTEAIGSGPFVEYVQFHIDNLAGRDPLTVRQQAWARYRDLVSGLNEQQLITPEKPDKWSIAGVFRHLADTELTFVYRMKLACVVDRPEVPPVSADDWAKALDYWNLDPHRAISAYHAQAEDTAAWYASLREKLRRREFVHSEMGPQSVALGFHILSSHDELHLKQVARIRQAVL
ncbi:DinB family protein [bacterium]|nr:DinB family protein [bacterium]